MKEKLTKEERNLQTKTKNQLILDKAMEDEFNKTLEIFDVFVESIGRVDPNKLKTKAFKKTNQELQDLSDEEKKTEEKNTHFSSKALEVLNKSASKGSKEKDNELIKRNMFDLRAKFGNIINDIKTDVY